MFTLIQYLTNLIDQRHVTQVPWRCSAVQCEAVAPGTDSCKYTGTEWAQG